MYNLLRISFLLTICNIFILKISLAQSDYEKQISGMAKIIAEKVILSGKKRVAVAEFIDNNGKQSEFGKAMSEEFSVNLMNFAIGFQVMERNDLNLILKENQLATTGLIEQETAKKLGKLKAVDLIVIGTIIPFSEYFRMSIKILDTETGMALGGTFGNIARTSPINKLFDNKFNSELENKSIINTNIISKPDQDEKKEHGDFCFNNKGNIEYAFSLGYTVKIDVISITDLKLLKTINVEQSETSCVYSLPVGVYKIELTWHDNNMGSDHRRDVKENKEIRVRVSKNNSMDLLHQHS